MDKEPQGRVIRSKGETICHEIVFILFVIYAITLLYPFLFLFINSFKVDPWEMLDNPLGLPQLPSLQSYVDAFNYKVNEATLLDMFFNTVTLAIGQTLVSMALTCFAAYTLAKYEFKGNKIIYTIIIISSIVPVFGAEAATYKLLAKDLNLKDNYLGMLMLCGGFGMHFLFLHSFFKEVSWSYAESAMIDGASDFRVFLQIMLPLAQNGVAIFAIMKFIGYWNEYWQAYLYYRAHPTLAVGLAEMSKMAGIAPEMPYSTFFATTILCIIPVLIFYAVFADKLMNNLTGGGIKG